MEDHIRIIKSVIQKYQKQLNVLHPKAMYPNEVENRKQYAINHMEEMSKEIKDLMKGNGIDDKDLKIRQEIINHLNQFCQYNSRRHPTL